MRFTAYAEPVMSQGCHATHNGTQPQAPTFSYGHLWTHPGPLSFISTKGDDSKGITSIQAEVG